MRNNEFMISIMVGRRPKLSIMNGANKGPLIFPNSLIDTIHEASSLDTEWSSRSFLRVIGIQPYARPIRNWLKKTAKKLCSFVFYEYFATEFIAYE